MRYTHMFGNANIQLLPGLLPFIRHVFAVSASSKRLLIQPFNSGSTGSDMLTEFFVTALSAYKVPAIAPLKISIEFSDILFGCDHASNRDCIGIMVLGEDGPVCLIWSPDQPLGVSGIGVSTMSLNQVTYRTAGHSAGEWAANRVVMGTSNITFDGSDDVKLVYKVYRNLNQYGIATFSMMCELYVNDVERESAIIELGDAQMLGLVYPIVAHNVIVGTNPNACTVYVSEIISDMGAV